MAIFKWYENQQVPSDMKVTQVYGVLFNADGQILLMHDKEDTNIGYSLPGGRPEDYDADMEATLRRELIEEVNTTVSKVIFAGYQSVDDEDGSSLDAHVRMAALIGEIGEVKPDPDNGRIYDRVLVAPEKAIELLDWGDSGAAMIRSAVKVFDEVLCNG